MDGSLEEDQKTPSSFDYNVNVTKEAVKIAHSFGVSVEGELGCLGSLETGMGEKEDGVGAEGVLAHDQLLTDPDEAVNFVKLTNVDALAIAIGTSHGAYKFSKPPTGDTLNMKRISEIIKDMFGTSPDNKALEAQAQAERNTRDFMRAQKIENDINTEIGEIREWQDVGSRNNLNPFGIDVFYMSKEKLIESLGHCYLTLKHIKKKLDEKA